MTPEREIECLKDIIRAQDALIEEYDAFIKMIKAQDAWKLIVAGQK